MPGPAPKQPSTRARRNKERAGFRSLPAGGRQGPVPPWPLFDDTTRTALLEHARDRVAALQVELADASDGHTKGRLRRDLNRQEIAVATLALQLEQARDTEEALWADLWAMPQATMWEEARAGREVAQYVRWKIRAEQGDLTAAVEARQLADRLGLTPLALMRLRTEIARAGDAEDRTNRRRQRSTPKGDGPDVDPRAGLHAV